MKEAEGSMYSVNLEVSEAVEGNQRSSSCANSHQTSLSTKDSSGFTKHGKERHPSTGLNTGQFEERFSLAYTATHSPRRILSENSPYTQDCRSADCRRLGTVEEVLWRCVHSTGWLLLLPLLWPPAILSSSHFSLNPLFAQA
jgi:hypothetical protein